MVETSCSSSAGVFCGRHADCRSRLDRASPLRQIVECLGGMAQETVGNLAAVMKVCVFVVAGIYFDAISANLA